MGNGVYRITEEFEDKVADYTGAKYVVSIDNQSNALFLALMYEKINGQNISIPSRTYPSVPYNEMLDLLVKTRLVITDSGGLQEECSFLNKKCLTCRIVTERPEAI